MFQRWLSVHEPRWLVVTIFLIGVAFELQAPYRNNSKVTRKQEEFRQQHQTASVSSDLPFAGKGR